MAELCIACGKYEDDPCVPAGPRIAPKKTNIKDEIAKKFGVDPSHIITSSDLGPLEQELVKMAMELLDVTRVWAASGSPNKDAIYAAAETHKQHLIDHADDPLDGHYVALARGGVDRIKSMMNKALAGQAIDQQFFGGPKPSATEGEQLVNALEDALRESGARLVTIDEDAHGHNEIPVHHLPGPSAYLRSEEQNDGDVVLVEEFDLSHEEARTYFFPAQDDGDPYETTVEEPERLYVRDGSQTHYVQTKDGYGVVISAGWTHIEVEPHHGEKPFKF